MGTLHKIVAQVILFFLPWGIRRRLLNFFFGYAIDPSARIGLSIILARRLKMDAQSRIHHFVLCKCVDRLFLGVDSGIASGTFITGFPSSDMRYFKAEPDRKCELVLGRSAGVTSRHFIDCNGGVYIGAFSTVAGIRTQILTHSINIYTNRQETRSVTIGEYCFLGTGCILLPGTVLPDFSVLGGGAVLTKAYSDTYTIYAGNPALPVKKLDGTETLYFQRKKHVVD